MNPPANWYPDPTGRHGQRYWDGDQWTEHVFTDGVQGVDALEPSPAAAEDTTQEDEPSLPDEGADDDLGLLDDLDDLDAADDDGVEPAASTAPDEAPADLATDGTAGLFGDRDAVAPEQDPWSPGDGLTDAGTEDDAPTADESPAAAVAPEVEPEDVVATVDEAAASTPGDFSDAFVLSPETASRLVGRSGAAAAPPTDDGEDAGDVGEVGDEEGAPEDSAAPPAERPVIDAPPPALPSRARPPTDAGDAPTSTTAGGLGITGDLVGGAFAEREDTGAVGLQNARLLRCRASDGVIARQGTMVAYQGDVHFERQGAGGMGRALKRAATGEGLAMMRVSGDGDVFLADGAQHVHLLHLEGGPGLSVNGRNVLGFSASLTWDIERVKGASLLAGGLFNTTLTGTGWVALVSDGEPVVLRTDEAPTYVDVNALVAWSAGLGTQIVNTVSARSLVGLGSGEAFQMAFEGPGIVIVQPSEGPLGAPSG